MIEQIQFTDTNKIALRFKKALNSYEENAFVQRQMAHQLIEELNRTNLPRINRAFEIGCGTGLLTRELLNFIEIDDFITNDLVPEFEPVIRSITDQHLNLKSYQHLAGDIQKICFPNQIDLICSGATLQWINNIDWFFNIAAESMVRDGLLAFTTFGPDNFCELKQILNIGLDYLSLNELAIKSAKWFRIESALEWKKTISFDTPVDILRHIKATGVNGLSNQTWNKGRLDQFIHDYESLKPANRTYPLTYHPQLMILRKL